MMFGDQIDKCLLLLHFMLTVVLAIKEVPPHIIASNASNDALLWGSYRPNLYFGMRPRLPLSVMSGLMWFGANDYNGIRKLRHSCNNDDGLTSFNWVVHDGRKYGKQLLDDTPNNVKITTEMIKIPEGGKGGSWSVKIKGEAEPDVKTSVIYYFSHEGNGQLNLDSIEDFTNSGFLPSKSPILRGSSMDLGDFTMKITTEKSNHPQDLYRQEDVFNNLNNWQVLGKVVDPGGHWMADRVVMSDMTKKAQTFTAEGTQNLPDPALLYVLSNTVESDANFYAFQNVFQGSFEFTVHYTSGLESDEKGPDLSNLAKNAISEFDNRFENTFHLNEKGYDFNQTRFAKVLLSNIMGSHGYFYGSSIVDWSTLEDDDEVNYKNVENRAELTFPKELFTVVPCRSFFPRGFLWDEGFHQLIVGLWDNDLSLDVIKHWMDLADEDGWIAREQILGEEARSKVPAEFQTQYPQYANPPTLVFAITAFLDRLDRSTKGGFTSGDVASLLMDNINQIPFNLDSSSNIMESSMFLNPDLGKSYLKDLYPKLRSHYLWFRRTQRGEIKAYGRRAKWSREAYRWRGGSGDHTLTSGLDDYPRSPLPHPGELHIDLISWIGSFTKTMIRIAEYIGNEDDVEDWTDYYDAIKDNIIDLHWNEKANLFCDIGINEFEESVHICHKGYMSLFPIMLGLLDPDSKYLKASLDLLEDPEEIWSDFGIRSLSKKDEFFGKGENYWRGPIWININYLVLSSLKKNYVHTPGPYAEQAKRIYEKLRTNVVENVFKEWMRTGSTWEQYNPINGQGQRNYPFSWTSVVLLIMAEQYP